MRKSNQTGRSMVEMLGVLAIIGVLSVGAIAGYQKAMMKYKLNKQAQQLTSIIVGTINLFRTETKNYDSKNISDILKTMNIIPKEMVKFNDDTFIYDPFNLPISVAIEKDEPPFFKITIPGNSSNRYMLEKDICQNIWLLSKQMHATLWQTHFIVGDEDSNSFGQRHYGSNYKSSALLTNLSVSQIDELCAICEKQPCMMRILWHE